MSIIIFAGIYHYFAVMANKNGKKKWHFGVFGIAVYIVFQLSFLYLYKIFTEFNKPNIFNENNYNSFSVINIISWLFAIGAVYGVYKILENKFKKEVSKSQVWEIEEIGAEEKKNIL